VDHSTTKSEKSARHEVVRDDQMADLGESEQFGTGKNACPTMISRVEVGLLIPRLRDETRNGLSPPNIILRFALAAITELEAKLGEYLIFFYIFNAGFLHPPTQYPYENRATPLVQTPRMGSAIHL
jgi:hypothetical protein